MKSIETMNDLFSNSKNIAFDIETEGFNAGSGDEITVFGIEPDNDRTIFLINGNSYKDVERKLAETDIDADFIVFDDEISLLSTGLVRVVDNMNTKHHRLYAYNGKTWKGGFDVPFIRTRMIQNNVDWCFDGVYYFDVLPEVKNDLNTNVVEDDESKERNDLDSAHSILCDDDIEDPFDTSKQAVSEDISMVVEHCYADIKRTRDLFNLIMDYTSAREVKELRESCYL